LQNYEEDPLTVANLLAYKTSTMADTASQLAIRFNATPLKRAKLIQRLGLVEIATAAGTSPATVSRVLNGKHPNSAALADICEVLGVDVADCFPETGAEMAAEVAE
jgi:hypothetical protein